MNFLGHFFFDHQKGRPAYNAGLVMPDLMKNFSGFRFSPHNEGFANISGIPSEIFEGCKQHIYRDGLFHNSGFFRHISELASEAFRKHNVADHIPRSWFLAHIASELLLDKVLQLQHPDLVSNFYKSFEKLTDEEMTYFLHAAGLENPEIFLKRLDRFKEARYLGAYRDNENLIYSLNRIYFQVGIKEEWNKMQYRRLEEALSGLQVHIESELPKLVSEMGML